MTYRVLIVDDHPLVATGLQFALMARGWEVEATSGPTAAAVVGHACTFKPDCVVLDVHLGADCGFALARALTAVQPGLRVYLLSAGGDPDPETVRASGACAFLRKSDVARADFAALCQG